MTILQWAMLSLSIGLACGAISVALRALQRRAFSHAKLNARLHGRRYLRLRHVKHE